MWDQANWPRIEAEVKRLQVRIAKATREGRWGKVQALQRLLTRSQSGKMLAVKRVRRIAVRERRGWTVRYGHPRRPDGTG
jgi:retron-type reverse transcriptase